MNQTENSSRSSSPWARSSSGPSPGAGGGPSGVLSLLCVTGLLAGSVLTSPGSAARGLVGEWLGLAEPGGRPTVDVPRARGDLQKEPIGSIVLASGRAPDGVRYEFVLESFAEPTKSSAWLGYGANYDPRSCPPQKNTPTTPMRSR